jgi:putative transposase
MFQRWPFCHWIAVIEDHFSRNIVGHAIFDRSPSAFGVSCWLDQAFAAAGKPKYLITDQGMQFRNEYEQWCKARGIGPRFGAIGQHGSIAIVERFIRSLKYEFLNRHRVPLDPKVFHRNVHDYVDWYNTIRPHQSLGGRTPDEVWNGTSKRLPIFEPRARYPDQAREFSAPKGTVLSLHIQCFGGHRELPVISIRSAA